METQAAYHDFSGFAQLRASARQGDGSANKDVASQFESIFIQMMLKSMRDTVPEGGLFDSSQMNSYQEMFDQQISLDMARKGGIGLAEIIERQLGKGSAGSENSIDKSSTNDAGSVERSPHNPFVSLNVTPLQAIVPQPVIPQSATPRPLITGLDQAMLGKGPVAVSRQNDELDHAGRDRMPSGPAEFVESIREYAGVAAAKLGVSANLLIAQVVLETGWGQKVIKHGDGESSFNLFGIKTSADWQGASVTRLTLEYRGGVAQKEPAQFRSYASLADSFEDYVAFLRTNPRYDQALNMAANGGDMTSKSTVVEGHADEYFARQLQAAGYATDPTYASKILAIKQRLDEDSGAMPVVLASNQSSRGGFAVESGAAL